MYAHYYRAWIIVLFPVTTVSAWVLLDAEWSLRTHIEIGGWRPRIAPSEQVGKKIMDSIPRASGSTNSVRICEYPSLQLRLRPEWTPALLTCQAPDYALTRLDFFAVLCRSRSVVSYQLMSI
ncbi:hypothetical protein CPB85DRAFT_1291807 [Mucidula mucida]|nr:hypothetical protein CPB85DRAFT_1291807 [Mucidula mucida]